MCDGVQLPDTKKEETKENGGEGEVRNHSTEGTRKSYYGMMICSTLDLLLDYLLEYLLTDMHTTNNGQ